MSEQNQSPKWDEMSAKVKCLPIGETLPGFPFQEKIPQDDEQAIYEIILRDGSIIKAMVDLTTQYRAEGIQWKQLHGINYDKYMVAAWRKVH
jgi:hypothetical protein